MPRSVAIVFSPDYGAELERLAFRTPVWLVDTPENHLAADEASRAALEWPHITVTLFRPPAGRPSREDWLRLIEQIGLLEKTLDSFEVIGAELSPAARAAFGEAGFGRFDESGGGFKARR